MLKEVCVENFTAIPEMIAAGANRLELNNDLAAGGTTPSFGVIKQAVEYAHINDVPVVVMIRPRGGNFVYNDSEIAMMCSDIQIASLCGADAVTFGCLTSENELDLGQMAALITLAKSVHLDIVMHMAFDELANSQQKNALEWLAKNGVKRVLTHGGSLQTPIEANVPHLKELVKWADQRIEILPGGGIRVQNRAEIARLVGVNQLHGTKIVIDQA